MTLTYRNSALKFIAKQDKVVRLRIVQALNGLLEIPPIGDIKKLKGVDKTYRLRVGSIRIIYSVDYNEHMVYIHSIDNRGDAYK